MKLLFQQSPWRMLQNWPGFGLDDDKNTSLSLGSMLSVL
jgi:hypothetical protein